MSDACRGALLFVLAALPACGRAQEETPPAPRPGTTLFELLDRVQVERFPDSNLPEELRALAMPVLAQRGHTLSPETWKHMGESPGRPGESLWKARTEIRLDLELGRTWLLHSGRACDPFNYTKRRRLENTHVGGWVDPAGTFTARWNPRDGTLMASSVERPGEVRFGWAPDADHDGLALEPVLSGAGRPADGRALRRTLTLDRITRPVLVAGSPSTLTLRIELEAIDELRLDVARWDVGFDARDGQLARGSSTSDGLVFRVLADEEELWSLAVQDANTFHAASLDLTPFQGRAVELSLETDPGPRGDARFDYGLWSGLSFHGRPRHAVERPHIVLVDIDTLRADRLGCYGYSRDTSPRLDRWVEREAVLFEDTLATANWTLPSTVSILTGLAPSQHRVTSVRTSMGDGLESIAARLHATGYETYGRSDGLFVSTAYGFASGFELFDDRLREPEELDRLGFEPELARIRERRSERPSFTFLQTYMVHEPYVLDRRFEDPARPYAGRFAQENPTKLDFPADPLDEADWRWLGDSYDAGVRRMDAMLGRFLEQLGAAFGSDPYLVIVTSDHGDEIGEHGSFGHGHSLHEELLRVPLLVRFPDGRARREPRPVSSLDLVPTMLDLAGLAAPPQLSGRSLHRPLPERRPRFAQHKDMGFAVDFDGWRLLTGTVNQRFGPLPRLVRSRAELDPEAGTEPHSDELHAQLDEFLAAYPALAEPPAVVKRMDAGRLDELRDLGYAGDE